MLKEFANHRMYSDVDPYEVLSTNKSGKLKTIRSMKTKELPWDKNFVAGGFCGTMANQNEQKWECTSNEDGQIFVIRKHKNGRWYDVCGGKYTIDDKPVKFYDYNF